MPCNFDVLSPNTHGIGDSNKRCKILNYMKKKNSSNGIIFLQETAVHLKKVHGLTNGVLGKIQSYKNFYHGASNARGVLIDFTESLQYKILSSKCDNNGRYIILNMQIQGSPFIIINYYAPDKENEQLLVLNEINQTIDELDVEQNTEITWRGDFNISFDSQLDTDWGNPKFKAESITKIMSMMSDHDYCDIYRARFPSARPFTWRQKKTLLSSVGWAISSSLIDVIRSVQSDHSTIVISRING